MDASSAGADRPRVLVADDQPDILLAVEVLLKSQGYEIRSVATPAAALDSLRGSAFDLVLMDLNYTRQPTSVREGIDLLARIEELDPLVPVVVMTASIGLSRLVSQSTWPAIMFDRPPSVGDVIEWKVPSGVRRLEIRDVLYQPEAAGEYEL